MRKSILILIILLIPQLCFGQMVIQSRDIKQPSETKLFISGNHQTPDFEDLSASKNQFTKYGDVKTVNEKSTTNPKYFPVGQDKGIYFDGIGDYLALSNSSDFCLGTGDFTIDFNLRFVTLASTMLYSFAALSSTNDLAYLYYDNTNHLLQFKWQTTASDIRANYSCPFTPSVGMWYHISIVRSGASCLMYINGIGQTVTAACAFNGNLDTSQSMYIGFHKYDNTLYLTGFLQNFRWSKGIARWTSNFTPPALNSTYPTDSYTKLYIKGHDKAVNTTAMTDDSGTSKTITTVGDTKVGYSRGTAAYFDGAGDYLTFPVIDSGDYTKTTSIELWYYPLSVTGNHCIYTGNDNNNGATNIMHIGQVLRISKWTNTSGGNYYADSPSVLTAVNKWYHIVFEWEAGTTTNGNVNFYINGTKYSATKALQTANTTYSASSKMGVFSTDYLSGYISNFIYKEGTYSLGSFTPPETEPVPDAYTKLLMRNNVLNIRDISATPKTINTAGNVTPRSIGSKQGIFFDGSGDYLALPLVSTSAMYLGTSDFTIEGWVYSLNTTISETIINVGAHPLVTPDGYTSTVIENKSSGICRFRIYNNVTTACADYTWPSVATSNKWNHIALVRSGPTFKCFINGISQTVTTVTGFTGNINAEGTNRYWQFGRSGYDGSMQLYGYLTDVRITGKALYTSNFTPPRRSGAF